MLKMLEPANAVAAASRGIRLSEIRDLGKLDLRGDPGDRAFMGAVGRTLDLLLPTEPCQSTVQGAVTAFWIGPDQWLITCPKDQLPDIRDRLDEATSSTACSITDISAARTVFRIAGPDALDVLAKGCPLDLHPRAARPGYVAGSVLAKITVLINLREADMVDLYLGRSFADYLWSWLEEAGMDCGLIVE